jgi:hypothetical protein
VNPNNGLLLVDPAYPGANITATNTVHHNSKYPSKVSLPVVKKRQLPEVHVLKEMQTAYPSLMTADNLDKYSAHLDKMLRRMKNKRT